MTINASLLEAIDTVTIPGTERFVAQEKFVVGKTPVKIARLDDRFKDWFSTKTEESVGVTTLCFSKLTRSELDGPIMAELGDAKETMLVQVYTLMEREANGEEGVLLTDGWANIFYVRDIKGRVRAVYISWSTDGWGVHAHSVDVGHKWVDRLRVFSLNS